MQKLRYLKVDLIRHKNPNYPEVYSYYDPLEIRLFRLCFSKVCFTCNTSLMLPGKTKLMMQWGFRSKQLLQEGQPRYYSCCRKKKRSAVLKCHKLGFPIIICYEETTQIFITYHILGTIHNRHF